MSDKRKSIVEYLAIHASENPLKIAVVANGIETTYSELWKLVRGYASYLFRKGIQKGDFVVTRASQSLDFVVIYFGVHLAGGVIASLERNLPESSVIDVTRKLKSKYIIADDIENNDFNFLSRKNILSIAEENYDEQFTFNFPLLSDSADILFTTGTTGDSKGVELSHNAISATAENLIDGCLYKKDTVMIVPGPLNHANAIRKLFTSIANGSTVYILSGMMNLMKFFEALDYSKGTISCCLPPAAIRTIFQNTGKKLGEYKNKIDFIESATSPLPEPDKERLRELLPGTRLYNNYGSSESASVCMYDYAQYPDKKGCVGLPGKNSKIIVVDGNKQEIKSSKERMGLLACIGDVNMKGYVGDAEKTKEVLSDGIVYTNDIGYIDSDGFVYVSGRKGDVINVGGLKVAPTEIESAALSIDGVEDCICIPVPDKITGSALKLLVVMKNGETLDSKKITASLRKNLESFKIPHFYEQVEKIARTYNGKLDRKAYL